jgi:hypothetical protein
MELNQVLSIIEEHLHEAAFHADQDWEFTTGGNGVNACEAYATLRGLVREINALSTEHTLINVNYDEDKMREKYKDDLEAYE